VPALCVLPPDVCEICHELNLKESVAAAGADLVTGFHHIVWMGDLNYRLEYGQQVRQRSQVLLCVDCCQSCAVRCQ
jgi:hypothetical protein